MQIYSYSRLEADSPECWRTFIIEKQNCQNVAISHFICYIRCSRDQHLSRQEQTVTCAHDPSPLSPNSANSVFFVQFGGNTRRRLWGEFHGKEFTLSLLNRIGIAAINWDPDMNRRWQAQWGKPPSCLAGVAVARRLSCLHHAWTGIWTTILDLQPRGAQHVFSWRTMPDI